MISRKVRKVRNLRLGLAPQAHIRLSEVLQNMIQQSLSFLLIRPKRKSDDFSQSYKSAKYEVRSSASATHPIVKSFTEYESAQPKLSFDPSRMKIR